MYQVLNVEQTEIYTTGDSTTHVRAYLVCDTTADLPGINDISGYTLEMGSRALVIQDAAKYCMQSDGTWTLQQSADLQSIITQLSDIDNQLQDTVKKDEVDASPTQGSDDPVSSGGVYNALQEKCALSDVFGMGTILQPTAEAPLDMDTITDVGTYTCSATYIANLQNRPENLTSVNLYFEVRRITVNRWMQTAYYQSTNADSFYIRWKTVSSWTTWRKFTGTAV